MTERLKELEVLVAKAEKSLKKAPKGSLIVTSSNGNSQFFQRVDKDKKYIPTSGKNMIKALAQKDYEQLLLKSADKEMQQIRKMLDRLSKIENCDVYSKLIPQRKELVTPYILPDDQYVEEWLCVKYKGKQIESNVGEIVTERGERVRSKSEKIIADKLNLLGIPYRYEYPLKLKEYGVIYPDFTLLNINTRKEIYMEHFGMMDNEEYCQKAINKIEQYEKNEIYIGKNLIVTFETSTHPLNVNVMEQMLKDMLAL